MKPLVAASLFLVFASPLFGQHDDWPDPAEDPTAWAVHQDHGDGFCDNVQGTVGGREVDCIDRTPNSSREWETSCFDSNPNNGSSADLECSAVATVLCPGLGEGSGSGKDYITFICYASAGAEVRSGILNGHGSYPLVKGVSCHNAVTAQSSTCGCIVNSTTDASFFGSRTPCQTTNCYLCGDV